MKTSLNLNDDVFEAAKREALRTGRTISEIVSEWARTGRDALKNKARRGKKFQPVDLGGAAQIDLSSRRNWMEALDDDRT